MSKVKFGDIVREVKVNVDRENNPYEFYVAGDHMDSEDLTIRRKGRFDTDDVGPAFTRIFKPGQILYGSRRTYLKKVAVADFEGICANTTFVLESKDPNVFCQELLPFIMLSDEFSKWSIGHSKGSTNPYVLFSDLAGYTLDLPSIEEQKVLADKLWAAYKVKESYRQLLSTTDDMLKAKFQEIQNDAYEEKLCKFIEIIRGVSYKPTDIRNEQDDNSSIILRANNIANGAINFDDIVYVDSDRVKTAQWLKKDDVLMCASSGSQEHVGKVALIDRNYKDVSFGAFCMVVRAKEIEPKYLLSLLMSKAFRTHIEMMCNGTNILNVRRDYVEEWSCPIASKELQQQFAEIATQAESTKASLRASIEAIDRVIRSLINQ